MSFKTLKKTFTRNIEAGGRKAIAEYLLLLTALAVFPAMFFALHEALAGVLVFGAIAVLFAIKLNIDAYFVQRDEADAQARLRRLEATAHHRALSHAIFDAASQCDAADKAAIQKAIEGVIKQFGHDGEEPRPQVLGIEVHGSFVEPSTARP